MKTKKFLSIILAAVMTISSLPAFSLTASADDDSEKAISLGASAIEVDDLIYYGKKNNESLQWKILSKNSNAVEPLTTVYFDSSVEYDVPGSDEMNDGMILERTNSLIVPSSAGLTMDKCNI